RGVLYVLASNEEKEKVIKDGQIYLEKLGFGNGVEYLAKDTDAPKDSLVANGVLGRVFMASGDLIDKEKELARLKEEQKKVQVEIDFALNKLNNQGFMAKAPERLKNEIKEKLAKSEEKMATILQSMKKYL
ncbi:MAG: hypothetical protein IJ938_02275, partial [Clostridia bacterium]|nr:hypothetical protein [Clostridia bacterium]